MKLPDTKELLQKLRFLSNYTSILIPVGVAVAAVIFIGISMLMGSKLKEEIKKNSLSMGKSVESLIDDAVPRDQWEVAQQYQSFYETDVNQITLIAEQTTERPLLNYRVFPKPPNDISIRIFDEFGRQFCESIEKQITRLNAGRCPTQAEITDSLKVSSATTGGGSITRTRPTYPSDTGAYEAAIVDELCKAKAEAASIYASPLDIAGYKYWLQGDETEKGFKYTTMEDAVEVCWCWQLGYWIIEDIFDTINKLNDGSNSVFTSPVKRLNAISFGTVKSDGQRTSIPDDRPHYVVSAGEGLANPLTRRVCKDDIDVMHFEFAIVIANKSLLPFIQQLCSSKEHTFYGYSGDEPGLVYKHNQITVLACDIKPVVQGDKKQGLSNRLTMAADENLYRYGDDSVIELKLDCEYIFVRAGYDKIKPESIKKLLGQLVETTAMQPVY